MDCSFDFHPEIDVQNDFYCDVAFVQGRYAVRRQNIHRQ